MILGRLAILLGDPIIFLSFNSLPKVKNGVYHYLV